MKRLTIFGLLFAVALVFGGFECYAKSVEYSGFLEDYPTFKKGKKGVDMVYVKEGVDFKKYKRIMLDQVVFYFKKDSEYKGIQPDKIQELADAYNKAFIDALNEAYPLTDKPGPDVMRVRVAITDLKASKPVFGTVTTIIPIGIGVNLIKKGATGKWVGIGSASMEAEFLDSVSNERILAAIDEKAGGKIDLGKLSPAKTAFKFWAKRLKTFLDDVQGVEQ
jgi:hypothetical protein